MVCLNHTDREAVTRCAACGKPLCGECRIHADGADYCSEKCRIAGKESGARSGDVIRSANSTAKKAGLRRIIYLLIVIVLSLFAWFFYTQNRESLEKKAREIRIQAEQAGKAVRDGAKNVVESGKKAIPDKSKYKTGRENLLK